MREKAEQTVTSVAFDKKTKVAFQCSRIKGQLIGTLHSANSLIGCFGV